MKLLHEGAQRQCGSCQVCCYAKGIVTGEMRKPAWVTCDHQCASGCAIYDDGRPVDCIDYRCEWHAGLLAEEDRPDRSGILIDKDNMPESAWGITRLIGVQNPRMLDIPGPGRALQDPIPLVRVVREVTPDALRRRRNWSRIEALSCDSPVTVLGHRAEVDAGRVVVLYNRFGVEGTVTPRVGGGCDFELDVAKGPQRILSW